tara:strand:- start:298 stop:603 length:306 start_codon:yes stop_codon:yes gene_type:complete
MRLPLRHTDTTTGVSLSIESRIRSALFCYYLTAIWRIRLNFPEPEALISVTILPGSIFRLTSSSDLFGFSKGFRQGFYFDRRHTRYFRWLFISIINSFAFA